MLKVEQDSCQRSSHLRDKMHRTTITLIALFVFGIIPNSTSRAEPSQPATNGESLPSDDIRTVEYDLITPKMTKGNPAAGKRVEHQLRRYIGTEVHHALFLPENWKEGQTYPVIVEYAGNGPYQNSYGDQCSGKVADCNLGYGISEGQDFIWICMPFISVDHQRNQRQWWGDLEESVLYCREAIQMLIDDFGADTENIFLAGFSRGAIACNYVGLHDDEIAKLWAGFICHSHYDGVRTWNYAGSDRTAAIERLKRLEGRPQFISHEKSVDATKKYLDEIGSTENLQMHSLPFRNHTDQWVLRNLPLRATLRAWVQSNLNR